MVLTANFISTGSYPVGWIYEESSNKKVGGIDFLSSLGIPAVDILAGDKIKFHGLAEPIDRRFGSSDKEKELKENYENAISDYRKIIDSFPSVSYSQTETFGEKALIQAIAIVENAWAAATGMVPSEPHRLTSTGTILVLCKKVKPKPKPKPKPGY